MTVLYPDRKARAVAVKKWSQSKKPPLQKGLVLSQSALEDYSLTKEELRTRLLLLAFAGLISAREKYLYSDMFTERRDLSLYLSTLCSILQREIKVCWLELHEWLCCFKTHEHRHQSRVIRRRRHTTICREVWKAIRWNKITKEKLSWVGNSQPLRSLKNEIEWNKIEAQYGASTLRENLFSLQDSMRFPNYLFHTQT